MNSKERVKLALDHQEPDRVPLHCSFTPEAEAKLAQHLGLEATRLEAYKSEGADMGLAMGHDLLTTWLGFATSYYAQDTASYTCEWGVEWQWVDYPTGRYTEAKSRPLADAVSLVNYRVPDPYREEIYDGARRLIESYGDEYYIVGAIPCTIFECSWALRGYDRLMLDMIENKRFAHELFDAVVEFSRVAGRKLIELGVDMIWVGDDFGGQTNMLISPRTWREFFKPRYAGLFAEFKAQNPKLKIAYHSDGNIEQIIPELIDIGLDVLNAVQPKCMDTASLKRKYGRHLSFWGTVDIQEVLPFGTVADVAREVKERILTMGPGGGFILAPTHNIQADTPVENVLAYYEAARRYGTYPLPKVP